MEKQFSQLEIGEQFTVNGIEYTKAQEVKISCCKSVNCYASANTNQKTYFPGNTLVMVTKNV
jgi:hypothetical protein